MSRILLTLAALVPLVAAGPSVSSCGAAGDILSNADFSVSPDPVDPSKPLTITATGTMGKLITAGTINADLELDVKFSFIINKKIPINSKVPFTFTPGFVAGATKLVVGPFQLPSIPSGLKASISGKVTLTDPTNKQILCVALNLSLLKEETAAELQHGEALEALALLGAPGSTHDTCSLYEIQGDTCGQSDLDCKYAKYAKAFQKGLADGTCASKGYTVKGGTKTIKVPVVGSIVVTTYTKGGASLAAQEPEAVTSCSQPSDHLKNPVISKSGGVTTVSGTLDEDVASATAVVDLSVKASIISLPIKMTVPVTLSPAIPKGALKATFGPKSTQRNALRANVAQPTGITVNVNGDIKVNDANSQEITCLKVQVP